MHAHTHVHTHVSMDRYVAIVLQGGAFLSSTLMLTWLHELKAVDSQALGFWEAGSRQESLLATICGTVLSFSPHDVARADHPMWGENVGCRR